MTIGEKIKFLRQKNDVTQEKLAEYLNISYQSISKWENNYAMPDISLVVPLANFFGVSIDELFDHNAEMENAEVEEYTKRDLELAHEGYVDERIALCREAVQKYPKNFMCLMNLAYAVWNRINSGNYPNEVREDSANETIAICERIIRDCTDNDIRSSALQMLVYTYGNKTLSCANEEKAVYYANMAGALHVCREILLCDAYFTEEGKKKARVMDEELNLNYLDLLSRGICTLNRYETDEEKIFVLETALKLWHTLIYDGNFLFYHCRLSRIYSNLAVIYANRQDKEKTIENLKQAFYHADKADTIPDHAKYTSMFFSAIENDFSKTTKNYTENEKQVIINSSKYKCYDFIREDKEFKEIFNL